MILKIISTNMNIFRSYKNFRYSFWSFDKIIKMAKNLEYLNI